MPISSTEFDLVSELVKKRAGIELPKGKEYLVDARLLTLAHKQEITVPELLTRLKLKKTDAERDVVDALTTNETSFFRDVTPFEAVKKAVLPELIAKRAAEKRLTIWCAASSTGQEPYTLAMIIRDHFPQLAQWQLNFIATDLSREVLAKAKQGKFSQLEINRGLPATLLVKHFKKQGLEWQINENVRNMIDFQEVNLTGAWPVMPAIDLVFIRNVLIYFSVETKKQILGRIRTLMRPDGYMFLGVAETTMNIDDKFERGQFEKSGCYQLRNEAPAQVAKRAA